MQRTALVFAAMAIAAGFSEGTAQAPEPAVFILDGVSSDQFESHPAFDPLSGDLYFVRSSPRFQGWRLWRSRCRADGPAAPEPAPFSGEGVEADPFFTPDGRRL